ncbi:MAG TPA: PQQ-binding-like beta-propeller repeat protein, partial [Bryobacteraceae bacterium]|nr:PQQ-binding-like beta-propeller repeat protein [Bryobacteraceae bacterium]
YIPGLVGAAFNFAADPKFVAKSPDVGEKGKGQYNMGISIAAPRAPDASVHDAKGAAKKDEKSKDDKADDSGAAAFVPPPPDPGLPKIGPEGQGNLLIAWDPIAGKERWRGQAAGQTQGGTMSAGSLVFVSTDKHLIVYRAENGEQLADIQTGLSMMSPPMTFMIDGKQYVAVSGGPANVVQSAFGSEPVETKKPLPPSRLLVYALDGKTALPKDLAAAISAGSASAR